MKRLAPSKKSMKSVSHLMNFYLWATQNFESVNNNVVHLFNAILGVFEKFP